MDGTSQVLRNLLWQQRNRGTRRKPNLTAVRVHLPAQNPQKHRLDRPIAPEQANSLPRLDLARDSIQEQGPAKTNPQLPDRN